MKNLFEKLLGPKKTYAHFMDEGAKAVENEQFSEAEKNYTKALEMAEEAKAHTAIAQISLALARINERLDKLAVAEGHYRRAYQTHEESEEFDDAARCLIFLGRLYYKQRRYPDAEQVLHYALAIYQQQYGQHYEGIAEAAVTLADCMMGQNSYEEAEKLLMRAISIDERKGEDHPALARQLHKLAVCLDKQQKDGDAAKHFAKAVEIYKKQEATFNKEVAHDACYCYHDFARHYLRLGKSTDARPLLEKAMELAEKHPGYLDEADLAEKTAAIK